MRKSELLNCRSCRMKKARDSWPDSKVGGEESELEACASRLPVAAAGLSMAAQARLNLEKLHLPRHRVESTEWPTLHLKTGVTGGLKYCH